LEALLSSELDELLPLGRRDSSLASRDLLLLLVLRLRSDPESLLDELRCLFREPCLGM